MTVTTGWTSADDAELDVLVFELVHAYWEHREACKSCRPGPCAEVVSYLEHRSGCAACLHGAKVATPQGGDPCPRYLAHLEHGLNCNACNGCRSLRKAIAEVVEWRDARELRSRAEALRARQQLTLEARAS